MDIRVEKVLLKFISIRWHFVYVINQMLGFVC